MHRAGAAFGGDGKRFVSDHQGSTCRQGKTGFGNGAKDLRLVQHLVGVGLCFVRVNGTGKHDQGHAVLMGVGYDVDAV